MQIFILVSLPGIEPESYS